MELAVKQGFDVRVVPLPPGVDPAEAAEGFEERLDAPVAYPLYRAALIVDDPPDRQAAHREARELLDGLPDSPERHEAWRYVNDRLGMTVQIRAAGSGTAMAGSAVSPRLLEAGERLERDALAGSLAHPKVLPLLAEMTPEHFDSEPNRLMREALVAAVDPPEELVPLRAELSARAAVEAIDESTAKELLLRLRERHLRREIATSEPERTRELQEQLGRVQEAVQSLA